VNEADTDRANQESVWNRIPLLEQKMPEEEAKLEIIKRMPSPRLFKTHLPFWFVEGELTKKECKCICVMRNPKDLLVSYFHFAQLRHPDYITDWNAWFDLFRAQEIQYGDWFDHVTGWWKNQGSRNFLFLKYEEMKTDIMATISQVSLFLGKNLSNVQKERIIKHTSFSKMKENPATNLQNCSILNQKKSSFMRKGIVGDWQNYFSDEQSEYIDHLYRRKLEPIGLEFKFL